MIDVQKIVPPIAESWIDTPYRFGAKQKGKGIDCARFIVAVYQEAGLMPMGYAPPYQHRDWHFGKNVKKDFFVKEILKFAEKMDESEARPGDVISFLYNKVESHLAVLVEDNCIVHAVSGKRVKKQRLKNYLNICSAYRIA